MGNQPSQAAEYSVSEEELRHAPHNFYLVDGSPSIRFMRDRMHGPLIYDLHVEEDEDGVVQRTAMLDLSSAVPRKQAFELISVASQPPPPTPRTAGSGRDSSGCLPPFVGPHGKGLALRFRIAATAPPNRVRVLTGVSLAYIPGDGIRLSSGDPSVRKPHCVFDTHETNGLGTVITRDEIFPHLLLPVKLEEAPQATDEMYNTQRVSYAPLVIEVDVGTTEYPSTNAGQPAVESTEVGGAAHASLPPSTPSSPPSHPTAPLSSSRRRTLHYTLLELPDGAREELASSRENEAAPAPLVCRVYRQLLQVGNEVYNLEDVFDMGRDDEEVPNALTVPDEDEALCVVCLTNPKNTTILPCRHMCLCSECAVHLRMSNNRCPLCRANIDRLMTI
ncbi:hypothetical protein ABL78_3993 [Leptomonas seymouri]|uniref:RING-type domain-containing protein n=1 Tax=Leptomonas seymouri TaxID=5684 RepID=A0A0N0P6A9_LEPSE|nr:hypothetical protein ABL78_3993 [Leptomonas seymouri]|eukprot:KPI86947.1 hypothetical protein ABL78_3993 [Leptomonas seymouri]